MSRTKGAISDNLNKTLDKLEERLNRIGEITTADAWEICGGSYSVCSSHFRRIMTAMVELKKAVQIRQGRWRIIKPNIPPIKPKKRAIVRGNSISY